MRFGRDGLFALKVFEVERIDDKRGLNKSNSGDKIGFDSLLVLDLILFVIFETNLSIDNFDNKGDSSSFLAFFIKKREMINNEEILWFDEYLATV